MQRGDEKSKRKKRRKIGKGGGGDGKLINEDLPKVKSSVPQHSLVKFPNPRDEALPLFIQRDNSTISERRVTYKTQKNSPD